MKIKIITNYFGPLPKWFQLWLDSCRWNGVIRWVFFTNQDVSSFDVPGNVEVVMMTMPELKDRLQSCFPYPVRYEKAWDFCAFKPMIGYVFAREIGDCDYWGACDCDLLWGDLKWLAEMDGKYDKIFPKGHLFLVKNDKALTEFTRMHPIMRQALDLTMKGLPCVDEVAYPNIILRDFGATQADVFPFVNLYCRHGHFSLKETDALNKVLKIKEGVCTPCVFTWKDGDLVGHFAMTGRRVVRVKLAYIHFFKREITPKVERFERGIVYLIKPNKIVRYMGGELSWWKIRWIDRPRIHWNYYIKRMNIQTMRRKVHMFLGRV